MPQEINLSICQVCRENPAVYGDGVTWSRCAKCELEYKREHQESDPEQPPTPLGEGFSHKLVKGLVSVIMPIYNVNYPLYHYTGNAIGSVRSHSKKGDYELIIVDNGSPVQPPNLAAYYAEKVIKWDENKGVTQAWNAGIRVSFGEYIVLLNNDTQVYEGWLDGLKEALDNGLDLAMAHPMYSLTEPFARWVESEAVRDGRKAFDKLDRDFACVMFKKDLFEKLDDGLLFDETFFNYCSDSDLLKRMDEKGLRYGVVDKVAIHHMIDVTGGSIPETPEIMNTDKKAFEEKWNPTSHGEIIFEQYKPNSEGGEDMDLTEIPTIELEAELERRKDYWPLEEAVEEKSKRDDIINTDFTGDKVFLVKQGETHWVKSPEILAALGAGFDDVRKVDREEFNKYMKGEDLSMENVERYK